MFKVECESCKSPFQIDERRVPPAGLKMRCPKCGHSFLVMAPSPAGASAGAPAAKPSADLPAAKPSADLPAAKPFADLPAAKPSAGARPGGPAPFASIGAKAAAPPPEADLPAAKPAPAVRPGGPAPFGSMGAKPAAPIAPPVPAIGSPTSPGASAPRPKNPLKSTFVGVGGGDFGPKPPAGAPVPAVTPAAGPKPSGLPMPINVPSPASPAVHSAPTISAKPPPSTMAALKKTMVGVAPAPLSAPPLSAPPGAAKAAPPAAPAIAPPVFARPGTTPPVRPELPSDFPASLGSLDEPDLPIISAPTKKGPPAPAPRPAGPSPAAPAISRAPLPPQKKEPAPPSSPPEEVDELDFDLPVVSADLPAPRGAPPQRPAPARPPEVDLPVAVSKGAAKARVEPDLPVVAAGPRAAAKPARSFEADLPIAAPRGGARVQDDLPVVAPSLPDIAGDLPTTKRRTTLDDLPIVSAVGLPSPAQILPDVAASLPSAGGAGLPVLADNLPVHAESLPALVDNLPVVASGGAFGEIELPTTNDSLPPSSPRQPSARPGEEFGLFGDMDLPREAPPGGVKSMPPVDPAADFGDLQLDDKRRSLRPASGAPASPSRSSGAPPAEATAGGATVSRDDGGMSFGEVELGGGNPESAPEVPIGTEAAIGTEASIGGEARISSAPPPRGPALDVALPGAAKGKAARKEKEEEKPKRRPLALGIAAGVLVLLLVGGAALQLTPYGAFGYLAISDITRASEYARAAVTAVDDAHAAMAADTFDAARKAADATDAAHGRLPRARPLTAVASLLDYVTNVRFGTDPARSARAKQLLSSLPIDQPVTFADAAAAAQAGDGGDPDRAGKLLEAAARNPANAPIQVDLWLARGDVAVAAHDGAAALAAYKHALERADDARGRYGLARAYDLLGDAASTQREIAATLAKSPQHPGALTLRARPRSTQAEPAAAVADLALVLDGPARAKASPMELSAAYAARAWVSLDKGAASDARDAFAQAVALDGHNIDALNGQGRLFLNEGRPTEALARFDTALQIDPGSPETIANDAEAKMSLERLADAKQQLVAAREKFPKSIPILILLGKVEHHLGNNDVAEADLRAATAYVDAGRAGAVAPYVALSELLSERGRLADAKTTLDDAKKQLPESAALERAFGEVSELQGDYDGAIGHYRAAIARDARDVASHFRLAVALLRLRRFEESGAEFDSVAAVDKEYPGLSLERGVLFEAQGDVQKAIEQFNGALAKAPDDPDLELRVGSAYVTIGHPDEAVPMLRKVLEKRPQSAEAQHYMGRALMLQGGPVMVDALRYLRKAVELDPNRAEYHVYLAWAANDATPAQLETARDEVDKALALDKVNADAYWQRGIVERVTAAVDDAIRDEKRALELRPSRYEAHATLAECYADKNDPTNAVAEWAKAIAGDGPAPQADGTVKHPFWHWRYGRLLRDQGGYPAALPQFLLALPTAEKTTPHPGWLADLEFASAEGLRRAGKRTEAIDHYQRFVEMATVNSPDLADAKAALMQLGAPR